MRGVLTNENANICRYADSEVNIIIIIMYNSSSSNNNNNNKKYCKLDQSNYSSRIIFSCIPPKLLCKINWIG